MAWTKRTHGLTGKMFEQILADAQFTEDAAVVGRRHVFHEGNIGRIGLLARAHWKLAEHRRVRNRVASQFNTQFSQPREIADARLVEIHVVVIISHILGLNKVGSDQSLALFVLCIVDRVFDRLGEINIVGQQHRQRFPQRDRAEGDGSVFRRPVDLREQPKPDVQHRVELVVEVSHQFFTAIIVALEQEESEIKSYRVGTTARVGLTGHCCRAVFEQSQRDGVVCVPDRSHRICRPVSTPHRQPALTRLCKGCEQRARLTELNLDPLVRIHRLIKPEDLIESTATHLHPDQGPARSRKCSNRAQRLRRQHFPRDGGVHQNRLMSDRLLHILCDQEGNPDRLEAMGQPQPGRIWIGQQDRQPAARTLAIPCPLCRHSRRNHRSMVGTGNAWKPIKFSLRNCDLRNGNGPEQRPPSDNDREADNGTSAQT